MIGRNLLALTLAGFVVLNVRLFKLSVKNIFLELRKKFKKNCENKMKFYRRSSIIMNHLMIIQYFVIISYEEET